MLSVGMALGASLAWGLADFLGGLRSRDGSPLPLLLVSQSLGLVLCGIALVLWAGPRPEASATGWAALSGCADLAGLWALYRGLACGAMGVVAPISAAGAVLPV